MTMHSCDICNITFTRASSKKRHIELFHPTKQVEMNDDSDEDGKEPRRVRKEESEEETDEENECEADLEGSCSKTLSRIIWTC